MSVMMVFHNLSMAEDNPLYGLHVKGRAWHVCGTELMGIPDGPYYCGLCEESGWLAASEFGREGQWG